MVVIRKQPVVPAPPISRTASSQPLPTKRQTHRLNAISSAQTPIAPGDQKTNGYRPTPSHSSPSTKPSKSEKKRKSKVFIDYLILFLLSGFTCYSFYVCRPNPLFSSPQYESQPSLCRALATYRTHVLEPYVLPPIKQTLQYGHKISEPYVEEVQAHLSPYFKPAKIIIHFLTPHAKSFIRITKSVWTNTVIPIYTQTVRPYYETAVVPRYTLYIKPLQNKVQKLFAYYVSNPVRSKTNFVLHKLHRFYTLHVDPCVRIARPHAHHFSNMTRAVALNLSTYTTYLRPSLLNVWNVVHSTVCTTWKHYFKVFFRFTDGIYTYLKWVAREIGAYRRLYVDQHVDRILEQVADSKLNGNIKEADDGPSLVIETRHASAQGVPDMPPQRTATADTPESEPSSSPIATPSMYTVPTLATSQFESSASMPKVEATNNPGSPEVEAALSVAEKSADNASTVIHEPKTEFDTLNDSDLTPTPPSSTPSAFAEVLPAMEPAVTTEPTPSSDLESNLDLDEFLRELGVGGQETSTPDDTNETFDDIVASVRPKSEEERLAEIAAKRADIVGRHEMWFEKLHARVKETGDRLVRTLQSLRDDSAEDIRRLGTRPSKVDPNKVVKEPVKDPRSLLLLEQDGEKLIKGLEMYLRKAEARCNDWRMPKDSPDDEAKKLKHDTASKEKEKFSDIVSKVEGRFSARVDGVRSEVHKWYVTLKEREVEEVLRASKAIKGLASQAQEDLAMDYAWLDDVTYLDWQKYHDLMRVHDSFDITVRQIANGTSTDRTPPSDPVLEALDELDRDLQDIILGFSYALLKMRSHGLKVFNSRPLNGEGNDDDDNGFFIVRDNERRVVDLRGVDLGKVELKKEAVGILPIKQDGDEVKESQESVGILPVPDAQLPGNGESRFDASKIIIGKDKVQVEEALRDIPLEPPAQRHAEL